MGLVPHFPHFKKDIFVVPRAIKSHLARHSCKRKKNKIPTGFPRKYVALTTGEPSRFCRLVLPGMDFDYQQVNVSGGRHGMF